jgi:RHS repeat-associated protein
VTRKSFVYLNGALVAEIHNSSEVFYHVTDHSGSTHVVTNNLGSIIQRVDYKPYGETYNVQGAATCFDFGFAGAHRESASGLYDFGARFYHPGLGRFLSLDPLFSNFSDPNELNPYAYARNNPLSFVDIGGLAADSSFGGGFWTALFYGFDPGQKELPPLTSNAPEGDTSETFSGDRYSHIRVASVPEVPQSSTVFLTDGLGNVTAAMDPQTGAATPLSDVHDYSYVRVTANAPTVTETALNIGFDIVFPTAVNLALDAVDPPIIPVSLGLAIVSAGGKELATGALEGVVEAARAIRFGQQGVSATFRHGEFAGKTIEEVAAGLRSGAISADQLPLQSITRDGIEYTLNNRSLMALRKAGMEPTLIQDMTGNAFFEKQLTQRLSEMGGAVSPEFVPIVRGR